MTTPPAPPTLGLRHLVLWVSNPEQSAAFYSKALGLEVKVVERDGAAIFMSSPGSATDHDLGLFRAPHPTPRVPGATGMYHVSWEVATLRELQAAKVRLTEMGALGGENNHGVSRSLYCADPDGNEFEIMWEVPLDVYDPAAPTNVPLDFESDFAAFGADRPGRGAA